MNCDDPTVANEFALDVLIDGDDFTPPRPIGDLLKEINRRNCCNVRVVESNDGAFLLRWEERHPEMISPEEYWASKGESEWLRNEEHGEYGELLDLLPSRTFERPLTRRQAFALIVACWLPEEFTPEIEALPF